MKKAVEDGLKYGLPPEYAEKYIKPYLPPLKPGEEPWDMVMVRTTVSFLLSLIEPCEGSDLSSSDMGGLLKFHGEMDLILLAISITSV